MIRKVATIMATALVMWATALGVTAEGAEFSCRDRVLINYAKPLEKMPRDYLPGERLPFAPPDLELRAGPSVVVQGDSVSYTLALTRPIAEDGRVTRPARLHWTVDMRFDSVDAHGWPLGTVRQRRWNLGVLRYPERQLDTRVGPGFYRVSLKIRKAGGPILSSYRQFIRVLPHRPNLKVGIRGGSSFQRGEIVAARVENPGTLEAFLPAGSGLTLERLNGERWTKVEADEPPSVMFEDPEFLPGGRASQCSFLPIPADSEPGTFRLKAAVKAGSTKARSIFRHFLVS